MKITKFCFGIGLTPSLWGIEFSIDFGERAVTVRLGPVYFFVEALE